MIQKDSIEVTSKLPQEKAGVVTGEADLLTSKIQSNLSNPASNPDFDLEGCVNEVLKYVGMSTTDSGGKLSFYGRDPIIPSRFRFGTMAAVALAAVDRLITTSRFDDGVLVYSGPCQPSEN